MIRLRTLLKENEEFQQLPSELKKHFLEIISTYGQHRESINRKSDIRQISETLGAIADAAQEYTLREGGDWFDRTTIKRNMGELKKLQSQFEKEANEAAAQQQRLESLYEDMGHVLGRYFEIADVSEDVMKQRLGLSVQKDGGGVDKQHDQEYGRIAKIHKAQQAQRVNESGCKSCTEQELKNKKK
jgi:hypothetical protein